MGRSKSAPIQAFASSANSAPKLTSQTSIKRASSEPISSQGTRCDYTSSSDSPNKKMKFIPVEAYSAPNQTMKFTPIKKDPINTTPASLDKTAVPSHLLKAHEPIPSGVSNNLEPIKLSPEVAANHAITTTATTKEAPHFAHGIGASLTTVHRDHFASGLQTAYQNRSETSHFFLHKSPTSVHAASDSAASPILHGCLHALQTRKLLSKHIRPSDALTQLRRHSLRHLYVARDNVRTLLEAKEPRRYLVGYPKMEPCLITEKRGIQVGSNITVARKIGPYTDDEGRVIPLAWARRAGKRIFRIGEAKREREAVTKQTEEREEKEMEVQLEGDREVERKDEERRLKNRIKAALKRAAEKAEVRKERPMTRGQAKRMSEEKDMSEEVMEETETEDEYEDETTPKVMEEE